MSYDLRIYKDSRYSAFTDLTTLKAYIAGLPNIVSNGDGFAIDDLSTNRWMEIYLEVYDEDGDSIEEENYNHNQINCINLCIPYSRLRPETLDQDYLQVARAISDFLNWTLKDLQTEKVYCARKVL